MSKLAPFREICENYRVSLRTNSQFWHACFCAKFNRRLVTLKSLSRAREKLNQPRTLSQMYDQTAYLILNFHLFIILTILVIFVNLMKMMAKSSILPNLTFFNVILTISCQSTLRFCERKVQNRQNHEKRLLLRQIRWFCQHFN